MYKQAQRKAIPKKVREDIKQRTLGRCGYCGVELRKGFHIDHVKPVYHGGTNEQENLIASCPSCNNFKSALNLEQFRKALEDQPQQARKRLGAVRLSLRYKLIEVKKTKVEFFFEKLLKVNK